MRDSHSRRSLLGFAVVSAALLLLSSSSSAQVKLSIELGFEDRLTPGHYAPILIEVHDYRAAESSYLRIIQRAGNAWRGEATLQQDLDYAIQSSGRYEAVIPIYDPLNPIAVELVSSTGEVLARETVDLRGTMRPTPYPVLDRQLPRFDDRAAIVASSSLPTQWWGFDSAESLWVASSLSSETWTAISQWVLAGGSLIVLTGSNFYRMDSPIFRDLLPISNPKVVTTDHGTTYLSGSHADATIDLLSDEGFPLLLHSDYGAGRISLVSVQAQLLSVEDLKEISTHIEPSTLLTLRAPTESILGSERIVTLNSLLLLGMITLLCLLVCVCVLIGRRNPRAGWATLVTCMIGLAVSSGFASIPAEHTVDIYIVNTLFYLQTDVSLLSVFSSLYSEISTPFIQTHVEGIIPLQFLPRTLNVTDSLDSLTGQGETKWQISFGGTRQWHAYGSTASLLDFEFLSNSVVRVNNYHPGKFDTAWVFIDGMVYPIAEIYHGNHEYILDPVSSFRLSALMADGYTQHEPSELQLVREVREVLSLSKGTWLVAAANEVRLIANDITQKVRDITLVVAQGEKEEREI